MKHYTSISQSKKLLELGLSPEGADMYWVYNHNIHTYDDIPRIVVIKNWDDKYNKNIPCWSLGALLDVIPCRNSISSRKGFIGDEKLYFCNCVFNDIEPINYNTPIEAAYSMIVYLLENGYIKKEGDN